MTIKDITFLKSIDPITVEKEPSAYTKETVSKIIISNDYIQYKKLFYQAYSIPPDGISIQPFIGHKLYNPDNPISAQMMAIFQMTTYPFKSELGMTDDLIFQLILLFVFNAFIDLRYFNGFVFQPIKFVLGKSHIASTIVTYPYEVGAIFIPYTTTQTQLFDWISKNWSDIQKQMDDNLTSNPFLNRIHKNIEIALEIIDLKDHQKKSFKETTDIISKKYPDDLRCSDGEWVKKTYRDNKVFLNIKPQSSKDK